MSLIHPSAIVDPAARLGEGVQIGPFCTVGPDVTLGDGVTLMSHVAIAGRTTVGARTRLFPFAAIGFPPQDLKYAGEASILRIGADCTLREGVTINPGTSGGGLETTIGDRCTFLAQAHVGHDCQVGDDVVLSNNVMLAGHVKVGSRAILGGGVGVHQFVRIGEMAFVGGLSGLEGDLIPYGMAIGNRARLHGLNLVGLRRSGASQATVAALRAIVVELFAHEGVLAERLARVTERFGADPYVSRVVGFVRDGGTRPLCRSERAAPRARP